MQVNDAGMGRPIPAIDVTVEDWNATMDLDRAHRGSRVLPGERRGPDGGRLGNI